MTPSVEAHDERGAPEGSSEALDDRTSVILSLQESSRDIEHLLLSLVKTSPTTGKGTKAIPTHVGVAWGGGRTARFQSMSTLCRRGEVLTSTRIKLSIAMDGKAGVLGIGIDLGESFSFRLAPNGTSGPL